MRVDREGTRDGSLLLQEDPETRKTREVARATHENVQKRKKSSFRGQALARNSCPLCSYFKDNQSCEDTTQNLAQQQHCPPWQSSSGFILFKRFEPVLLA
jgi:hypothetical protein